MGSKYLTAMGDWFRAAGLQVVEEPGWESRARSSGGYDGNKPWAVMWHHTASDTSPQNDVDYICHGSPDRPISNILLARDGAVYLCAAGATNTNGKGGPWTVSRGTVPKDSMNTHAVSIEIANNGVGEEFPRLQIDAAFKVSLVLAEKLGLRPDDALIHQRWAPDRKIDPATASAVEGPWQPRSTNSSGTWNQDDLEDELLNRATSEPEPEPEPEPPDEEEDVQVVEVGVHGIDARFLGYKVRQTTERGLTDFILWVEWVNGADPNQLNRLQLYRNFGVPVHMLASVDDFKGIGLLGPVPTGDKTFNWTAEHFGSTVTI